MPLTNNKSGITILTADVANSWYGGLYDQPEAVGLDSNDPLVAGHVHDGQHLDGHAQKINLSEHTVGQLDGSSILDDSITLDKFEEVTAEIIEYCSITGCGLLLLTNDGRLIVDGYGDIVLKDEL